MTLPRAKSPLMKRLMRWLFPEQRVANRHAMPPLIAYLGPFRSSKEYKVADVSIAGFYMITEEQWIVGTRFPITLARTDGADRSRTITVHATVTRRGEDGVGFSFLQPDPEKNSALESDSNIRVDLTKLAQFLKGLPLAEQNVAHFERVS